MGARGVASRASPAGAAAARAACLPWLRAAQRDPGTPGWLSPLRVSAPLPGSAAPAHRLPPPAQAVVELTISRAVLCSVCARQGTGDSGLSSLHASVPWPGSAAPAHRPPPPAVAQAVMIVLGSQPIMVCYVLPKQQQLSEQHTTAEDLSPLRTSVPWLGGAALAHRLPPPARAEDQTSSQQLAIHTACSAQQA